jgi:hypothetical protein
MSLLVHPENQRLIWDIVNNNPFVIQFFQTNVHIKKEQWFKTIMEHFYNTYQGKSIDKNELNQLNKEVLTYMIQNLYAMTTPAPPTMQSPPPNPLQNAITTPPIPENNREEQYKQQFLQKQQEYSTLFDKKLPPEINFRETEKDVAISNMDELIQKQQAERNAYMNLHPMPEQGISQPVNSLQPDNIKFMPDEPSTKITQPVTTSSETYNSQIMELLNTQMSEIAALRGLIVDMSKQLIITNEQLMLMKQTNFSQIISNQITTPSAMPIHQMYDVLVETVESDNE